MLKPISEIKADLGIQANGPAQSFFTNTCYKHMDKYVPKRDENLRTIVRIESDSITYQSEYAEYQYKGMRKDGTHVVRNYTTPRYWTVLG